MANVFDVLKERGFLKQVTHEGLEETLKKQSVTFYIGFDPTADSLHVGHYVQLMAMSHMQRFGHKPIALVGGGTAMVGDPSGKSDMRKMMDTDTIKNNVECFKKQIGKFLDFSPGQAIMVNNADWLLKLNYVEFLRDIGAHFSVNRMLGAECFKSRLEKGLSFLEFNYMLMQSYDFLELFKEYDCTLQLGGDDQWSNILMGADLIRRKTRKPAFGMTFSLLLTSEGKKMGKTEKGAVWLDAAKTSPYEFYQYWRNVQDADVKTCLSLMTFLPMDEVNRLSAQQGQEINEAKKVLAFEVTKQVHGEDEARKAQTAAAALFSGSGQGGSIPESVISQTDLTDLILIDLMQTCGLTKSRGEGRRLIKQGGVSLNGEKVTDEFMPITADTFDNDELMIKKGKKAFHKVTLK